MSNRYLSSIAVGFLLFQAHQGWSQNNVGVDVATPLQKLDVNGAIRIGTTSNNLAGSIRWNGTRFEGYNGSQWVSFETPSLLNGRIFVGNASDVATGVIMSGDATISNTGVLTLANNAVTSGKIADGTIVNADVDAAAAIARTKLASGTANRLLVNDASGVMSQLAAGTDGFYLQLVAGAPAWVDAGSGFIRNQNTLQTTSNFYISNVGRTDGSFQSPLYTRADAGTVAVRPNTNSATAIQLQNATGTSILNVDATNSRVGIGNVAPDAVLEVTGDVFLSRGSGRSVAVEDATGTSAGNSLVVKAGNCDAGNVTTSAAGGSVSILAGTAYSLIGDKGGDVLIQSGGNRGTSPGGDIVLSTGTSNHTGVFFERLRIKHTGTIQSKNDIYIDSNAMGIILRSPNNSCWKLVVDNTGALTTTSVTCP